MQENKEQPKRQYKLEQPGLRTGICAVCHGCDRGFVPLPAAFVIFDV